MFILFSCVFESLSLLGRCEGGVGCGLPFAPVSSLGERWWMVNQMAHAVGVNLGVVGVLPSNVVSIGDSYGLRMTCLVKIKEWRDGRH